MAPDTLPRDVDPYAAVPDSAHSEFRRMLSFIVDLFRGLQVLLLLLLLALSLRTSLVLLLPLPLQSF